MIDLYTAATGNGRRAAVMVAECGLTSQTHVVDLAKGGGKTPEFLKLNPMGAIPVIVDQDGPGGRPLTLSQSGAILIYLAEKSGKFLPKDGAKRAEVLQWFMHALTDQQPTSSAMFYVSQLPDKPASAATMFEGRLVNFMRFVDRRLGEAAYLAGEVSIADFALYPIMVARQPLIDKTSGLDNLKRWMAALQARPGVAKGMRVGT